MQKSVPNHCHLASLPPEWDSSACLVWVGGRLQRLQNPSMGEIPPIMLDPRHPTMKLFIRHINECFLHIGIEWVYAEIQRQILQGSCKDLVRMTGHQTPPIELPILPAIESSNKVHDRRKPETLWGFCSYGTPTERKAEEYQIQFKLNTSNALHFSGTWEREVKSIKASLQVAMGSQAVLEDVLYTTIVEVEGILNSEPLGYMSADVTNPYTITPNILLMGWWDVVLPQVYYFTVL